MNKEMHVTVNVNIYTLRCKQASDECQRRYSEEHAEETTVNEWWSFRQWCYRHSSKPDRCCFRQWCVYVGTGNLALLLLLLLFYIFKIVLLSFYSNTIGSLRFRRNTVNKTVLFWWPDPSDPSLSLWLFCVCNYRIIELHI